MNLMKGDRFLVVSEDMGLSVIDIEKAIVVNPTVGNKDVHKLVKLGLNGENGAGSFAGCTT
jgi:hypothetical protein